jgi:hypothetical protein
VSLNECLGDNQLFVTLKKCVPAWQKKYADSNAHKNIDNINNLADYYGHLENQGDLICHWFMHVEPIPMPISHLTHPTP